MAKGNKTKKTNTENKPFEASAAPDGASGYSIAQICEAIADNGGLISTTCRKLKISRTSFYRLMKRSPELREAIDDARHAFVDAAESCLVRAMQNGSVPAAIYVLNNLGRKRGYGTTQDPAAMEAVMQRLGQVLGAHDEPPIDEPPHDEAIGGGDDLEDMMRRIAGMAADFGGIEAVKQRFSEILGGV